MTTTVTANQSTKKKRGRPFGSKNKKTIEREAQAKSHTDATPDLFTLAREKDSFFTPVTHTQRRVPVNKSTELSAKDVCDIITASKGAGLSEIKYANLELTFHKSDNTDQTRPVKMIPVEPNDEGLASVPDLDQLMMDDPAGFEQQIMDDENRN